MEMQRVRYFIELYEERHFTRAAKRCGVSQPSLTNGIKRMEKGIPGPLFKQNKRGPTLSGLGTVVKSDLCKIGRAAQMVTGRNAALSHSPPSAWRKR